MVFSTLRSRQDLHLENLALRHQTLVLQRQSKKPKLKNRDRFLWTILSRLWKNWRRPLLLVQPDTVVLWHRQGFRWYWRRKSCGPGRPQVAREIRDLQRDRVADGILDKPADHRGLSVGHCAEVSDPRSRWSLRHRLHPTSRFGGNRTDADIRPFALAEPIR